MGRNRAGARRILLHVSGSGLARNSTQSGKTDEFLPPLIFSHPDEQRVRDNDIVIFFNFRADRARQLSQAFSFTKIRWLRPRSLAPGALRHAHAIRRDVSGPVIFEPQSLAKILGEVVSGAGKTQLRIAETEKYPHVTYFFNGGVEEPFAGEKRNIIPSPKVATYDLQPEMSAPAVTDEVLARMADYDLVILNFANPDMVGHTGVVDAGVKAVETIDHCVERIVTGLLEGGGKCLITADHGNCEQMRNSDGSPNTAHTTNLVHFLYVAADAAAFTCQDGILADVAPTLLFLLGLPQPVEMSGKNLLKRAANPGKT